MPVPSAISDLSQTAGSNSPAGSESPNTADDYFRTHAAFIATLRDGKGFTDPVTLASGATTDIGAQNAMFVEITGTTTIISFGTTYEGPRFLRFTGILTLTHNATTLNLPGAANITTAAGDTCIAIPNSTPNGWNVVQYQFAADSPGSLRAASINNLTTITLDPAADYLAIADGSDSGNAKKALLPAATDSASGIVELATTAEAQAGTDTARAITPATLFGGLNASGSAPIYACRAWVNFNGTGTVAIRASGNVSSITDNNTGDYTVNFTTAMPDANYSFYGFCGTNNTTTPVIAFQNTNTVKTSGLFRIYTARSTGGGAIDVEDISCAIFR